MNLQTYLTLSTQRDRKTTVPGSWPTSHIPGAGFVSADFQVKPTVKEHKKKHKVKATAGPDYYETYIGFQPIPSSHPPSLRNPLHTKVPTAQDGWHKGDSKKAKDRAMSDLVEIHKRLRRQTGKPELSKTADFPLFPDIAKWT